jgi:DNA-binding MarR family transcriptional regulator
MAPSTFKRGDYRALAELRYEIRRFLASSEQAARESGLEPRQHQLLLALKGLPEDSRPTIGELARRLRVEHHSAVEMVDRLEQRHYVARGRDPLDRRRVLVRLTSRGEALMRSMSAAHKDELRRAAPLADSLRGILRPVGSSPAKKKKGSAPRKRTS